MIYHWSNDTIKVFIMGKILIVSFNDNEEQVFRQTVEWLSWELSSPPAFIKQQLSGFQIDPFTRTLVNDKGENIYLTVKEFDLLYFLFCHKKGIYKGTAL